MSTKYPFIPEYLEKALENVEIPLIDLIYGHLKVVMIDCEEKLERCDQDDEREWLDGYMQALTEIYCLTYNLSIDRQHIEENQ